MSVKRWVATFGIAVLAVGAPCAFAVPPPTARTVVLPASAGKTAIGVPADWFWTPTPAEIRALEASLKSHPPAAIGGYYRQYLGIVQGGKRLIYVNGFSPDVVPEFTGPQGNWRHQFVFVNDGGNSFCHVLYDPKTRRFSGFQFNGMG